MKTTLFTFITLFALLTPVWAETPVNPFPHYLGQTVNEVIAREGVPQLFFDYAPFPGLSYPDKVVMGYRYQVRYMILGHRVAAAYFELSRDDQLPASSRNPGRGPADYLGKSAAELIRLEGPPAIYVNAGSLAPDYLEFRNVMFNGKQFDALLYDLENDVVIAVSYISSFNMPGAEIRPFVLGLDEAMMAGLDDPSWVLLNTDLPPRSPEAPSPDERWRFYRNAIGAPVSFYLMASSVPLKDSVNMTLSVWDSSAPGPLARKAAAEQIDRILEFAPNASQSFNLEKLQTLLN